jgi:hypothetical protein
MSSMAVHGMNKPAKGLLKMDSWKFKNTLMSMAVHETRALAPMLLKTKNLKF